MRFLLTFLVFLIFSNNLVAQACFTPWNSSTVYASPTSVSHNGRNYTSKWWTQGNQPGSDPSGVWTDNGACSSCSSVNPGSIGSAQSIVSGATPNALTSISAASGGNGASYTYQWQVSTNNSTWTDISGANATTYSPVALTTNTYFRRRASSGACGDGFTNSILTSIIIPIDSDGDGIFNHIDLDDDNDGILDTQECPSGNFQWSGIPVISGNSATGSFGSVNYTYNSSAPVQTTADIYNHGIFPSSYGIPNTTSIQNNVISSNTLIFDRVIKDPVLVFSSIGNGGQTVPIKFGAPIEVLWSTAVTQIDNLNISGTEGYAVVRMNGTFSQISFDYLANEGYVNFFFGVDFTNNCDTDGDGVVNTLDTDSDGDGCSDAIEGGAAFTSSNISSDKLTGSVDVNGVPISATASGQTVGNSANAAVSDPTCPPCPDNDADGVCDQIDLDDDNDGILDVTECPAGNFQWSTPPTVSGTNTATGTINGFVNYTYSSDQPVQTETVFQGIGSFPAQYNFAGGTNVMNTQVSSNTITFSQPVTDPILAFGSIGAAGFPVGITFSNPVEILWSQDVVQNSPTQITGSEGHTIVKLKGVFTQFSFNYLLSEFRVNFAFGADFSNDCDIDNDGIANSFDLDSDADGCADAIEGGAAFKSSDLSGQSLSGSVDAKGIPIVATASGQSVGSSQNVNVQDVECCTKPTVSTSDTKVCVGASITASPAAGGTWTSSNASVATISNAGVITGVAAGIVTFTFTNATGCSATTNNVTVNSLPGVSASDTKVYVGSTINASPTTGGTWTSSNPAVATISNDGVITGVSAGTATFTFTNTATSCSSTTSTIDILLGQACFTSWDFNTQYVKDSKVSYNGRNYTAQWCCSKGNTPGSPPPSDVWLDKGSCGGCATPIVSTSDTKVCVGSALTASPTSGGAWTSSNTSVATISNTGVITGVTAGSATFTFTNTGGCSSTTNSVTVNTKPQVTLIDAEICAGDPAATFDAGAGFTSYTWSNNGSGNLQTASGTNTGAYTVVVADANGCKDTANANLTLKTNCGCVSDNDQDGVCDEDDLDDDNDGILDVIECADNSASWDFETPVVGAGNNNQGNSFQGWTCTSGGWINLIHPPYGGLVPQTASSGNQYVEVGGSGDFSRPYSVVSAGVVTVEIDFASWGNGTEQTQINIFKADGTTLVAQSPVITTPPPSDWNNAWQNKGRVSALLQPGDYVIKFSLGNYQAFDNVRIASANLANCDTDNDGIVNTLDTDSDGDGCSDAIEGGGAFKTADLNGLSLSGALDANGVPVVAGASGQTAGASANSAIKDVDCINCDIKPVSPEVNGVSSSEIYSFVFDAQKELNETTPILKAGKQYKFKVTGTWSVWTTDPNNHPLDAAYRFADKMTGIPIGTPIEGTYVKLNGATHPKPEPNQYNALHEYWYNYTGAGQALNFTFSDSYGDNHGTLTYTFYSPIDTIIVCASSTIASLGQFVSGTNLLWYTSETGGVGSATSPNVNNAVEALYTHWVSQTLNGCESDRTPLYYKVLGKPNVSLGNDTTICTGENLKITAPSATSYLWNTAETSNNITVSAAGDYSVEITDANGCKASAAIHVKVNSCVTDFIEKDTLTICEGDSIVISAIGITTQVWGGTDVFKSIDKSSIKVSPTKNANYFIRDSSGYTRGTNIIVNGNFESGSGIGFTVDPSCSEVPATSGGSNNQWSIGNGVQWTGSAFKNPNLPSPLPSGVGGKVFYMDGGQTPNIAIYRTQVSVVAGNSYEFSAYVANMFNSQFPCSPAGPPELRFAIDGEKLGYITGLSINEQRWTQFNTTWISTKTGTINIELLNNNAAGCGNDFAIDAIEFVPIQYTTQNAKDSVVVIVNSLPTVSTSDTKVCVGASITASPATDGTWISSNTSVATISNAGVITGVAAGTATFTFTNTGGCSSTTNTVTVNTKPQVTLIDAEICAGDPAATFDAGSSYTTYAWTANGTGTSQTTIGTAAGTYTVRVIDANGCKDTSSATLTVNTKPNVVLVNATICSGDAAASFDAGAGYTTYAWSANGTGTSQTTIGTAAGTYTVRVIDANGCKDTSSATLTVNTKPNVVLTNATICSGDAAASFDAGAGYTTYTWSANGAGAARTTTGTSAGTYAVRVVDANGCKDTSSATLLVNTKPNVIISNDTICDGDAAVIFDAGAGYSTYLWSDKGTGNTQKTNGAIAGTYTVAVVDAKGCKDTASAILKVNSKPTVQFVAILPICKDFPSFPLKGATPLGGVYEVEDGSNWKVDSVFDVPSKPKGNYKIRYTYKDANACANTVSASVVVNDFPKLQIEDQEICQGDPAVFDAGSNFLNYRWSTGSNLSKISAAKEGVYSVSVTDHNGCRTSDTMVLKMNALPIVDLGESQKICSGEIVTLESSTTGDNYLWNDGSKNKTLQVKTTGTYSLNIIDSNLCVGTDHVEITVIALPKVNLGSDQEICEGKVVSLSVKDPKASYYWSTGEKKSTISVGATNTITLTQYYDADCLVKDSVSVTVLPFPKLELGNDTTLCLSETFDGSLTLAAGSLADSYLWSTGSTNSNISIDARGTYSVSLTNGKSCMVSDQITIDDLCKTSLFCPSAFTPNNDGNNDVFYVKGANVDYFQLLIFNRWGDVVFESDDMNKGWDGTVNENIVQQDVYVVKVIYSINREKGYKTKEQIISSLTLIR